MRNYQRFDGSKLAFRLGVAVVPLMISLMPASAYAQDARNAEAQTAQDNQPASASQPRQGVADPAAQAAGSGATQDIVVTGSAIKRLDYQTASPIQLITGSDLINSGYDTVTSVLSNVTANGAGTLSSNNSEAFAGGASGVALRGLSVGATLGSKPSQHVEG